MHKPTYALEIQSMLAHMDSNGEDEKESSGTRTDEEIEDIDVYVEPDKGRITFIKRTEPQPELRDAMQPAQSTPQPYVAYIAMTMSLLLIFYLVTSAFLTVFFPPVITITLFMKSQAIQTTGTIQLPARQILPITLIQSQSVPTTGRGHTDARSANGYITFYNGQLSDVTIPAGTQIAGRSGVLINTDADANIPAASINPPAFGYITVPAHAINPGSNGNIAAYDINSPCCFASVIAKNEEQFTGGQDERDFPIVTRQDIDNAASTPKSTIAENMQAALQPQAKANETLITLPCSPTVRPNHTIGEEATQVTVTVSETCQSYAFSTATFYSQVATILSQRAKKVLGARYTRRGNILITRHATRMTKTVVTIAFTSQAVFEYALSTQAQRQIKNLLAGKRKQDALRILLLHPGINQAVITGIDDLAKLPKDLHLLIVP